MDFTLSGDQELLRDSLHALLAKECPSSLVRAHIDDRSAGDPLWKHLQEWTDLAGGPLVDLCLALEEMGAVLAPGPFFATTVLYAGLGLDGVGTVAMAGADGQWVVNDDPVKRFVPEADRVDSIAFVLPGPRLVVVDADTVDLQPLPTIDLSRRMFEARVPDGGASAGGTGAVDAGVVDAMLDRAYVAAAAEMLGTARWIFETTLAYAKERVQFDRPIGSFQAIKHKLANMALAREEAWAAVYYAAMCVDAAEDDRHRAAHVAKAMAGEAARLCAKDGIQIHGGIGYTWEHDLHLYIRRVYGSENMLGPTAWHHDRLADLLL